MTKKMTVLSAKTKKDWKIEQNRGYLGVLLLREKKGFQCVGSGSVVNLVQSKHFPSCKEVKCLLTSGDVFLDGDSSRIDDYVMDYWDSDLKSIQKLKLKHVAQSTDFYRPTSFSGLALIPLLPEKVPSILSYFNLKSYVLDDRRTFHTGYYCNEGGKSETQNVVSLRCFIAGSFGKDSLEVKPFTLISTKDKQRQLRYKLTDDHDGSAFETYGKIKAERPHLYPRGAAILEYKFKPDGKEPKVTCVGALNFSKDDKKEIYPVFFSEKTLTG